MDENDIKLSETYEVIWSEVGKLTNKGTEPLMIAGTLMAQAMRLYKTALSEDDYGRMMQSIMDSKDEVKPYGPNDKTMLH